MSDLSLYLIQKHLPGRVEYVDAMGTTYADVTVLQLAADEPTLTERFLVDSGATECVMARDKLDQLGVQPVASQVYTLADDVRVEMEYGYVRVRLLGKETVSPIVFAPEGSESLLGVTVMEHLALVIDPKTRQLFMRDSLSLRAIHR